MLERYALIQALKTVLNAPNTSFSVRGLAKESGLSLGTVRATLDYMQKKGIVTLKKVGTTYQYKADLPNPLCRQWKILFNLDGLIDSKIMEEIIQKVPHVQSVLLYGSFARGTNDEKSDIDLLIIAHQSVKADLSFAKAKKEINLSILSLSDWKKKAVSDKVFYENVIYDSIVLFGERPVIL
jgi:predicted nucleotidyltransferase